MLEKTLKQKKQVLNWRTAAATLHDILVAVLAWMLAYWLRFNFFIPVQYVLAMQQSLAWIVAIQAVVFFGFGLYRGIWRFASIPDLRRIGLAVATSAVAVPTLLLMFGRLHDVPRSVFVLDPILLVLMMGGSRFLYRAWKDGHLFSLRQLGATPVIVMGAGAAGAALLRSLDSDTRWRVVGLLDDDPNKIGSRLHGVTVLGPIKDLPLHAPQRNVENAIIAMVRATAGQRRRAVEIAAEAGINVLTIPSMGDVLSGKVAVSQVRRVELEDLLGRDAVQLDAAGLHGLLSAKVVLVTGAGGSIGSELCRQIAAFGPSRLVLYELSELALYTIEQEFVQCFPELPISLVIGDVKDAALIDQTFAFYKPQVVFHAAAYKHVPLMERQNAWAAVRNNVAGTASLARAAIQHSVDKFVLISTDKAVNPTNVMGASKRLAELVCQVLQRQITLTPKPSPVGAGEGSTTHFVSVRFGNVLGSSGSVIPKFREQIEKGGPVTVTHPDIVRYFMLIPEATQLVLQAALMGNGADIFVLDMGEPIKIADLARDMIRLSGFSDDEIRIEFTGLRPGEKLYEELLADSETTLPTPHPKLRVSRADEVPSTEWLSDLDTWLDVSFRTSAEVKQSLRNWVPEYQPATH